MGIVMPPKAYTLVLIRKEKEVLLGLKKRGFGVGKWCGFGGKVEDGETLLTAAARELEEESGLIVLPADLVQIGVMEFEFVENPIPMQVHVFTTSSYSGNLVETEEMKPQWFDIADIPFHKMWADDESWYPLYLAGKKFRAYFKFLNHDVMLSQSVQEVDCL